MADADPTVATKQPIDSSIVGGIQKLRGYFRCTQSGHGLLYKCCKHFDIINVSMRSLLMLSMMINLTTLNKFYWFSGRLNNESEHEFRKHFMTKLITIAPFSKHQ